MLTQTSTPKRIVGRDSGRVIESIPITRVLAKRSALAAFVALAGFGFSSIAGAADVGLAWNANPETDIAGYRLSYGTSSGQYTQVKEVGRDTRTLVTNLEAGRTYYFAVAAAADQAPPRVTKSQGSDSSSMMIIQGYKWCQKSAD